MNPLFLILFLPFCLFAAKPEKTFGDVVADTVYRVYDGDTFYVGISAWPAIIGDHIGIRVAGIDTPEMRDKRPRIKNMARQARALRRGKYFRIVADVYCDGNSLAELLIAAGLARPYFGGKKVSW